MDLVYGWVYAWLALPVVVCVAAPYLLGMRPRSRLEWGAMTATVAFLGWLLGGFVSLRS